MSVKIRPLNVRINLINPGIVRTPNQQEDFCLWALYGVDYLLDFIPDLVVVFKSAEQGAQSFYFALFALFS